MTEPPLVSIVIPVYNAARYLHRTIDSALAQSWANTEVIVVDDGSSDGSLRIVSAYDSPRLTVLTQDRKGASCARNLGLRHAQGQYIQFLDADDLLSTDKIACQIAAINGLSGRLAVCSTVHFKEGQKHNEIPPSLYEENFLYNTDDPADFLITLWGGHGTGGSMVQPNAWLVPKEVIDKAGAWDENISVDDDGEFFCRVILHSTGITKTEGVYNYYRKYNKRQSLSGGKGLPQLKSLLRSVLSKKNALLAVRDSPAARLAIYRQLNELFIYSYPRYPEVYKKALSERPVIDQPVDINIGGKSINLIARLLGVKTALYIRYLFKKNI